MVKYHISKKTQKPAQCRAQERPCPLGENAHHFATQAEAISFVEDSLEKTHGATTKSLSKEPKTFPLWTPNGIIDIADGDLSLERTREAFATGLCGDLALAMHEKTGRNIYFVVPKDITKQEFEEGLNKNPDYIQDMALHAVIASKERGHFVDSYGKQSRATIINFYKKAFDSSYHLLKGNRAALESFSSYRAPVKYEAFAQTALEFDEKSITFEKRIEEY